MSHKALGDIIAGLNDEQRQAVLAGDGPLLVVAGAGSGKTRVLTVRIAHLVLERGVAPEKILAITFTRKAATEMKERLEGLLGEAGAGIWAATFHSALIKLLRPYSDEIGLKPNWTIIDQDDARTTIKHCTEDLKYDPKVVSPGATMSAISGWKSRMVTPKQAWDVADDDFAVAQARIYAAYQEALAEANAVDFDDILLKAVHLLQNHPDILDKFQRRFDYLFVDEYQDTNVVQHTLVKMLADGHRNICVVGDSDQCLPGNTLIETPEGSKRADEVSVGDIVLGSSGASWLQPSRITHVQEGRWSGEISVVEAGGRRLAGTPHHILLADQAAFTSEKWAVFLVRKAEGYWGIEVHTTSRLSSQAERESWILSIHDSEYEARLDRLDILGRRAGHSSQGELNEWQAERVMDDFCLHRDFPFGPGMFSPSDGSVWVTMFSDPATGVTYHQVDCRGENEDQARHLISLGFDVMPLPGQNGVTCIAAERAEYREAAELARAASAALDWPIRRQAQVDQHLYTFTPLAHLRPGMVLLVQGDDGMERAPVVGVSVEEHEGTVYDFEVEGLHNYVANGVLVHNSIYRFRAAEIANILEFDKLFPNTTTVTLERNYRSTATILQAANAVIANNSGRPEKNLWTETDAGAEIVVHALPDNEEECRWIAKQIVRQLNRGRKGGDIAVLCRIKAIAEDIEKALIGREVPCRLVGGLGFLQRAVVKDALCYLRMVVNPDDQPAFRRVVNTPRRQVGDASIRKIRSWAKVNGLQLSEALTKIDLMELPPAAERGMEDFLNVLRIAREMSEDQSTDAGMVLEYVLQRVGYYEHVTGLGSDVTAGKLGDLATLVKIASSYGSPGEFLEEIMLMADEEEGGDDSNRVLIMTMHASKGLEFDVVFSPGWEDGIFPSLREHTKDEQEEERRLAYVVITRARQQLFLTRARRRMLWGKTQQNAPSPFLDELPVELTSIPD